MEKSLIKQLCDANIDEVIGIYNLAKNYNLENDQIILDWQDKLNEISVK
jgi:hypothetical protein